MRNAIQQSWQRARWYSWLLLPLSLLYISMVQIRGLAYRWGFLKSHKVPVAVVVVGNLSVGGTGKTPLVIELVEALKARGRRPGVIARGYCGHSKRCSHEITAEDTAAQVGDEPRLIFERCRVPVVVGPNRVESAQLLLKKHACDVVLSDDGFQHFALQRELDIVVIDGERGFGNGWCLPAGPLREPRSALARADMIVVNGEQQHENDRYDHVFSMHTYIEHAIQIYGKETRSLTKFSGKSAHVVAGIGNPKRFFSQLQAHGIEIIAHEYPDHHRFKREDFVFASHLQELPILMTEKDAVKCRVLIDEQTDRRQYWKIPLRVRLDTALVPAVCTHL